MCSMTTISVTPASYSDFITVSQMAASLPPSQRRYISQAGHVYALRSALQKCNLHICRASLEAHSFHRLHIYYRSVSLPVCGSHVPSLDFPILHSPLCIIFAVAVKLPPYSRVPILSISVFAFSAFPPCFFPIHPVYW